MHGIRKSALASALALGLGLASGPAAAQFSNLVFFGDSLVDAGSFKPVLPPGTGLFTTNPGPIWVTPFGQHYGVNVTPANQGGTDYAEGGARVTQLPGVPAAPPTGTATPVANQVQNYLKNPVDPKALYTFWAGGDDLLFQIEAVGMGAITPAQAQANMALAATQLVQQVGILSAAGAKYIMIFNLPDAGKTPFGVASGQGPQISALTGFFNDTLNAGLNALKIDVIRLNAFGLLNEVIANPGSFGLANVTTPACGAAPALLCTPADLVAPNAAQTFLFADGDHPTTAAHQLLADYALSVVTAPQQMGLLANAPVQVEQATFRTLDDRMFSALNSRRPTSKYEAYAVYDYGNNDLSGSVGGGNTYANTIVIGGDSKITEQFLAGIAFGYTEDKASLGNSSGGFKLDDATLTVYLGYGSGPWYLGATIGGGSLDYRDIHRSFALGPGSHTENGSTNGLQFIVRALGGYWFNTSGQWLHGPYGRVTYQNIKVDAFAESGTSSTAMSFGSQHFDPTSTSLGWQVAGSLGSIRPYGRASWEYNNNGNRTVTASLVTMPGEFSLPAYTFDKNYTLFTLGASADLGPKLVGFISVSATAGNSSGNYQAVTVGVRAPL